MPESQKTKSENLVAKSPTTDLQPKNAETQKPRKINRKNMIGREGIRVVGKGSWKEREVGKF